MYSLEWLLHPVTPAAFFQDYYEQKSLLVERNDPARFASLLTLDSIDTFLASTSPRTTDFFLVDAARELKPEDYSIPDADGIGRIDLPRVHELFRSGATISISHLNERMPELASLCEAVEKTFSHQFQTNIYLSPPDAQGFKTHYDSHDVFVLQVSGSKIWTLYDTQVQLPLHSQGFNPETHKAGPASQEFTLHAGDVFYCPRGLYHSARSTAHTSLHITLGLIGKTWADAMVEAVAEACLASPSFRRNLPAGFASDGFDAGRASSVFKALVQEFAQGAELPKILDRFASDFVTSRRPVFYGGLQGEDADNPVTSRTKLSPRPHLICRVDQSGEHCVVLFGSSEITFPAAVAEPLRFCLTQPSFVAGDLPGDLDDPGKLVLVRRLLKEGLLVRPPPSRRH